MRKFQSDKSERIFANNLEIYKDITKRSPTKSDFSVSQADRSDRKNLFDEFLKEEFE